MPALLIIASVIAAVVPGKGQGFTLVFPILDVVSVLVAVLTLNYIMIGLVGKFDTLLTYHLSQKVAVTIL